MKKALILGVSGQDGAYLAQLLLAKGYDVHGTSRESHSQDFSRLKLLAVKNKVCLHRLPPLDFQSLLGVITQVGPDEVYNLAGHSSVGLSFSQPMETMESIALGTWQILEALRILKSPARLCNASSGECFGDTGPRRACDETTPFHPCSPYAASKAAAFHATATYREAYGLFACSGILFNHESPLRSPGFATRKIVSTAVQIARGGTMKLELGNLETWRDWGYAPEHVDAMWRMLQRDKPDDFVIATGESHSLQEFVELVFKTLSLNWRDHVTVNPRLFRPTDVKYSLGNPAKARTELSWKANTLFADLVPLLIEAERKGAAL
jgi:GDPmannose 4,6-dehydratase